MQFNDLQKNIIQKAEGSNVVVAGAGVGKTATIIGLLHKLNQVNRIPLTKFFVVTFTNKSSHDLKKKIAKKFGLEKEQVSELWVGTFHSLAYRYLKTYSNIRKTIMVPNESSILLKTLYKDMLIRESLKSEIIPYKDIIRAIDLSRSTNRPLSDFTEHSSICKEISLSYMESKKKMSVLDFDDVLIEFYNEIRKEEILNKFEWFFVDEAQDNNFIQNQITDIFFNKNCICVGDPKQSIYRFRGATPSLFMNRVSNAKNLYDLNINYRSSKAILDFANILIKQKEEYKNQTLRHSKDIGIKPIFYCTENPVNLIIANIKKDMEKGVPPKDIAILSRSVKSAGILELQIALKQNSISYEVRGGLDSLNSSYAQNYISLLKTLCSPNKMSALNTLQLIKGIGPKTAMEKADELELCQFDFASVKWVGSFTGSLSFKKFLDLTLLLEDQELLQRSLEFYYNYVLLPNYKTEDAFTKREALKNSIVDFLSKQEDLPRGLDTLLMRDSEDDKSKNLIISNIHVSKGLEWSSVHIFDFYEGSIPSISSFKDSDEEEEFCLAYVAVTRARDNLYLYMPTYNKDKSPNKMSRYLKYVYKTTKDKFCTFRFIRPDESAFKEKLYNLLNNE